jgi:hypothetical protein
MYSQTFEVASERVVSDFPRNSLSSRDTTYVLIRASVFPRVPSFAAGAFLAAAVVACLTAEVPPRRRAAPAVLNMLANF